MGHYAAEMGYQTPAERAEKTQKNLEESRKVLKANPMPKLKKGNFVDIAVKEYCYLCDSIEQTFLNQCSYLIHKKAIKGIKVLGTKKEKGRTYVRLGRILLIDLWYDVQLFKKVA